MSQFKERKYALQNDHDETIYDLLKIKLEDNDQDQAQENAKENRLSNRTYISKYRKSVLQEKKKGKSLRKTMGEAEVSLSPPNEYLKKHKKEPCFGEVMCFKYPDADQRRPPVPKVSEKPPKIEKSDKDFIKENIQDILHAAPRQPEPRLVDTCKGNVFPLETSGLVPKYINKKEFGVPPSYLVQRKADFEQAKDFYRAYVTSEHEKESLQQLSEEDRNTILHGLKQNLEELHRTYLGLSVVTDTIPKKHRKQQLEADMKQLEKDIQLLEKHHEIYITKS
ncbi:enkurin-like [Limulus polyphemus]|uniref:Enkurin-like n=1 Tax=Limulus polyphemus TaxID=6850 RepID=A0ABM1BTE8_LIMPO|nr:enkurin-like [Limulus polyphemus]